MQISSELKKILWVSYLNKFKKKNLIIKFVIDKET